MMSIVFMKVKGSSPFIILMMLLGLYGCEDTDSTHIRTAGVYAKMKGSTDANGLTKITVQLTLGPLSNTVLELRDGDTLTATAGGVTKVLQRDIDWGVLFGNIEYATDFNVGNSQGTKFQVSFNRSSRDISAPNSYAFLPAPFSIDMPPPGSSFDQNDDIILIWSPRGDVNEKMRFETRSDCNGSISIRSLIGPLDDGMAVYKASDLIPESLESGTVCETKITLERVDSGVIDSRFDDGFFHIDQSRSVSVKIVVP